VWRTGPARHEAGSPNVLGVAALARAVQELAKLDEPEWSGHESVLRERLIRGLESLPGIEVLQIFSDSVHSVGVVSFVVAGVPASYLATYLSAEWGIGVRDGKFCAHPLLAKLGLDQPALRASFGVGSTEGDVDRLLEGIARFQQVGPRASYEFVDGRWIVADDARSRPDWAPELSGSDGFYGCAA
jgi:selenocysteine lyase/cysteine desulfurase